ncbi:cytochrome b-c1 complex subunit 2, mitochondrial-like [Anneissia japonica]|uniref:cytochrome b-c1 complex subunit 2, mitochondrial-like n=1 Tax=Anneissia japonica TaxID=1529436 RepID=UPI00142550F4|nr:cytochrome b-c1 complex subunit 2, mitochondrial-like [Anneissia japonica]
MLFRSNLRFISRSVSKRFQTAQASAATADRNALPAQDAQVSKLANGLTVASLENYSPVSRIGIIVNAGSRYETTKNLGVTHCLRAFANLTCKGATTFSITRGLEDAGASLEASTTRDHMLYSINCLRDNLDIAGNYLISIAGGQEFRRWEVNDSKYRVNIDLALAETQPQIDVMERLHGAAFRGNLGNSLFCPKYMLDAFTTDVLKDFVNTHFTAENMALVGVGVDHDTLKALGEKLAVQRGSKVNNASKYVGGVESRAQNRSELVHAAVAVEGAGIQNQDVLTLSVMQYLLGPEPCVKWGSHMATSKLNQAAAKATQSPFHASCLNLSYADTGLFGFYVLGQANEMQSVLKAAMGQFGGLTKGNIDEKDFQRAKNQLKSSLMMQCEDQGTFFEHLAVQSLTTGNYQPLTDVLKQIDNIKPQDAVTVAKKVFNGKPVMVANGDLVNTPYLDELL